ncbi:signal transduction histidine kinase [Streptomyces puniciscabiei]|uniref:histidine kinase n=2 Tax=Streptomyces puniciscabiei TaxID=164348 RepID=A0A542T074_9ACTN|nr:ATP-binding protein [Streptomyces puniciscabiei]TQK80218.1 signal transduction histidine kinase [Streptomyces puniciscabiei]
MSDLRAPANRADRREGGRHGRPVARPAPGLPETHIRPQLMRLAVLPPLAVALSASAAVIFSIRSTGARTGPTLWAVLAGAVAVTVAGILIAAVAADRAARSVSDRVDALRRIAARGEADLHALVDALRQGEAPPQRAPRRRPPEDADDFEQLAADLARAHDGAVTAVVRAAQLSSQTGSEQKLEVFVNLARRLQSLVHREISILDELENEIEDPELLKGLFHVDHLATRIRRHAENLAVLGGAVSRRQWSNPVSMTEVLRSAIAEVEQYSRVKLVPPIDGELRGHAVADVIHLLAELIENASVFSAPHTQVLLRAGLVTSGLAVEVEDRGLGMPVGEQNRMNALLADPDQVNVASLLADGRIGLYVVSQLARRHGIHVRLQTNIYGGVQAVLVVPQALLGTAPGPAGAVAGAGAHRPQDPADTGASPQVRPQGQAPSPAQPLRGRTGGGDHTGMGPAGHPAAARGSGPTASGSGTASASGGGTAYAARTGSEADTRPGAEARPAPGTTAPHGSGIGAASAYGGEAGSRSGPVPVTGRRRHAQRGGGPRDAESGGVPAGAENGSGWPGAEHGDGGRSEGGLAPLPVRGARQDRPNPAEALPGISAGDRAVVEAHAGTLPTPRAGTVRGTMSKPQLPRRRAQQHIVPQLRGGPAPRQDGDTVAGHDPGLMAAFQRGIGLAEAQQRMESQEPARPDPGYLDSGHMGQAPTGPAHMEATHMDGAHMESAHRDTAPADPMMSHHLRPALPAFTDPPRAQTDHMGSDHTGSDHMDPTPISPGRTHAPASDGAHTTGRPDGSAPAG